METWVLEWLQQQREMGVKCLEIKYIQGKPYVYHSTSVWDKETKKTKKVSHYVGRLTRDRGILARGSTRQSQKSGTPHSISRPRSSVEYGNVQLLSQEFQELVPVLTEAFPDHWQEIIALVFTRVSGYLPLKRVRTSWEKLDPPYGILPDCSPRNLSEIMRAIGDDILGQDIVFKYLRQGNQHLIYDLSFVFSVSDNLSLAEWGHNANEIAIPQVNIALFTGFETGLPVMLRPIPGSVKDVSTLLPSMNELQLRDAILIVDRGFVSDKVVNEIIKRDCSFILPQRRNSHYFGTPVDLTDTFRYHSRLIHGGKQQIEKMILYLFEDEDLKLEERKTLFDRVENGSLTKDKEKILEKLAGRILFLSNVNKTPREIYELYKTRDMVEKFFDAFKNEIRADILYLGDRSAVSGHLFIGFLCLYLYCKIMALIKRADLTAKYSPKDVLLLFSKVMKISYEGFEQITEVPKKVRELEKKLGVNIFPK
jgi:transposase